MINKIYWHYPHVRFWMGGTSFIYDVAIQLKELGYNTTLVTQSGSEKILAKFKTVFDQVIVTSWISTHSLIYWIFFPVFISFDIIQCLKVMNEDKEGVHLATLFPSNFIVAMCSSILKRPFYYYCYEPFPFFQNPQFIKSFDFPKRQFLGLLAFIYKPLDTWATQRAEKIITLNAITQRMIQKVYDKQSIISGVGVDTQHFSPQKNDKYKKMFQGKKIITHSTDYSKMKNTDLAIQIFAEVHKKDKNTVLMITSTRPDAPEKKIYTDRVQKLLLTSVVKFEGLLSYQDLPVLYSNSWVYLSTSADEMFGTTSSNMPVKQSLACGTPALRANITTEDVEDGVSGYLIDPYNVSDSARKMLLCLKEFKKNRQMGLQGRNKIKKLYSWKQVTQNIVQAIYD